MKRSSTAKITFDILNLSLLIGIGILCLLPILHMAAVSLSGRGPTSANLVGLWPVQMNGNAYRGIMQSTPFPDAFVITLKRAALGTFLNVCLTILLAYPLSKETRSFPGRNVYAWMIVFTMLFSGGLIPGYMLIKQLGLMNSIWALVLPTAVPVFNVVLLLNFFRQLPRELEESAVIDGANHRVLIMRIFIPLSLPALATVSLFSLVHHWNSWFDGLIYMSDSRNYPLQTYLRLLVDRVQSASVSLSDVEAADIVSNRSALSAQLMLAILPILVLYPFLQKYFKDGIVLGSVKG